MASASAPAPIADLGYAVWILIQESKQFAMDADLEAHRGNSREEFLLRDKAWAYKQAADLLGQHG